MKNTNAQLGVGLIEVLVALLLLAIAILGFSAMQMRAMTATDESLIRTQAMSVSKNLAEVMRAYPEAYVSRNGTTLTTVLLTDKANLSSAIPAVQATINIDQPTVTVDSVSITKDSCLSSTTKLDAKGKKIPVSNCNMSQLATRDALIFNQNAKDEEIDLNVLTCPGTNKQAIQKQMCILTAWGGTKAILDDSDTKACAKANGTYKRGNHCLIVEAY